VLSNDRFRSNRHFMDGAMAVVREPLWMTNSKTGTCSFMTRVRGGDRVALRERVEHRGSGDSAGPTATTDSLKLAVPICRRQPYFYLDI
jgi:hypothetical protein